MSAQPPLPGADARSFRFEQSALAVGVLCGFVFDQPAVIPIFAALSAASSVMGDAAPLPHLWHAFFAPRLRRMKGPADDPGGWRAAAFLNAVLLSLATLVLFVGDRGFAWFFALPAAGLGALAGAGGICVGCQLHTGRRRSR